MKIIHGPSNIAGNASELANAQRQLGTKSLSIATGVRTGASPDDLPDVVVYTQSDFFLFKELKRWAAIAKLLPSADVWHCNNGSSIAPSILPKKQNFFENICVVFYNFFYARWLNFFDVKLAHFFGKVVVMTYQGSDARQHDFCISNYKIHFYHQFSQTKLSRRNDELKRSSIEKIDKYADLIYTVNPDLLNLLPERAKFIPYSSVDLNKWETVGIDTKKRVLKIVHAPTNKKIKGTKYLVEAVKKLELENHPIDFEIIENIDKSRVKEKYKDADIFVDQLLIGFYGATAVEFMALGKPVICYLCEKDIAKLPLEMQNDIPIITANQFDIFDVLKSLIKIQRNDLKEIGLNSRKYVEKWHDPNKIAQRTIDDYRLAIKNKRTRQ